MKEGQEGLAGTQPDPPSGFAAAASQPENEIIDLFDLTDSDNESPVRPTAALYTNELLPKSAAAPVQHQEQQQQQQHHTKKRKKKKLHKSKQDRHVDRGNNNEEATANGKAKTSSKRKHHETIDESLPLKKTTTTKNKNRHKKNRSDETASSSIVSRPSGREQIDGIQSIHTAPGGSIEPQQKTTETSVISSAISGSRKTKDGRRKRKRKRTRVMELSIPTEAEMFLYGVSGLAAISAQDTEMKLSKKKRWDLLPKQPLNPTDSSLTVRVSLRENGPLLIRYENVWPTTDATTRGERQPPARAKLPFRHVLFSNPMLEGITTRPKNISPSAMLNNLSLHDGHPRVKEWFPHDKFESILTERERELAWLFEESHHCFRGVQEVTRDWDFVWAYASPALKVELRKFEDDNHQSKFNNLVRWNDPFVKARMTAVQSYIRFLLNIGFRRLHMKRVIAVLRLVQPKDNHGNRKYPKPDFEAAANQRYPYFSNLQQNRKGVMHKRKQLVVATAAAAERK